MEFESLVKITNKRNVGLTTVLTASDDRIREDAARISSLIH